MAGDGTESVRIHKLVVYFMYILVQALDVMEGAVTGIKHDVHSNEQEWEFAQRPEGRVLGVIAHSAPFSQRDPDANDGQDGGDRVDGRQTNGLVDQTPIHVLERFTLRVLHSRCGQLPFGLVPNVDGEVEEALHEPYGRADRGPSHRKIAITATCDEIGEEYIAVDKEGCPVVE